MIVRVGVSLRAKQYAVEQVRGVLLFKDSIRERDSEEEQVLYPTTWSSRE
jgi:hypothetical protein